jgi:uncharacterized membrane protein YoaK (UPF0700 family)
MTGGDNNLTRTLRHRTIYLAILLVFTVGAAAGALVVLARQSCSQLRAEQQRTIALFSVLAVTAEHDGAEQSAAALRTYAAQAKGTLPRC